MKNTVSNDITKTLNEIFVVVVSVIFNRMYNKSLLIGLTLDTSSGIKKNCTKNKLTILNKIS